MKQFITIPVLTAAIFSTACSGAERSWPADMKSSAIAGCRASIWQHTEQDFMAKRKITRDQLPPDFRERAASFLEPYLAVCDCAMDRLSREWDAEYFLSHQADVPAKLEQFTSAGVCLPLPAAQPVTPPDAQKAARR